MNMRVHSKNQAIGKARRRWALLVTVLLATAGTLQMSWAFAADPESSAAGDAEKIAGQVCASCHGPGGASTSPIFPVLAGQHEEYLAAQLRAFKDRTRSDPEAHNYMWTMATLVSDSMIDTLAHYYASQPPVAGKPGNPEAVAKGKELFEKGDAKRNIMACTSCHGQSAEGHWVFPRLAGQRSQYVFRQLQVIQAQLRKSPIMHGIVKDLKPGEMEDLGAYLQSIP